jgi:hypothetical protein
MALGAFVARIHAHRNRAKEPVSTVRSSTACRKMQHRCNGSFRPRHAGCSGNEKAQIPGSLPIFGAFWPYLARTINSVVPFVDRATATKPREGTAARGPLSPRIGDATRRHACELAGGSRGHMYIRGSGASVVPNLFGLGAKWISITRPLYSSTVTVRLPSSV